MAKHAQHIVMIHFPIALFAMSVLFDLIAAWRNSATLRMAAYYNLIAAAVSSVLTVGTGIAAWQLLYEGGRPSGILLFHMIGAGISFLLLWSLVVIRFPRRSDASRSISYLYWAIAWIALGAIMATGHLGGILSGLIQLAE